jgi:CRISPR-associated protein Cmr1
VHFGGVGGRTSRGFGALSLQEGAWVEGLGTWEEAWQPRFAPPDHEHLGARLSELGLGCAVGQAPPPWPSLRHAQALIGPLDRSALDAHERLIDTLREFRQGPGLGREEGRIKREGVSCWPEAGVLRGLCEAAHPGRIRWEHAPDRRAGAHDATDRPGRAF